MGTVDKKKALGAGAIVVVLGACLLLLVRETANSGSPGEARNPNFGHPTVANSTYKKLGPANIRDQTEDDYYQALKINRPDLNEQQLREKSDHWWKIKTGDAHPSGG